VSDARTSVSLVDTDGWLADTRTSYDAVAGSYADQLRAGLDEEPYLRAVLALFAELVRASGGGPVADVGCGPGHVTRTCTIRVSMRSASTFHP
jgi:hypothetical protein